MDVPFRILSVTTLLYDVGYADLIGEKWWKVVVCFNENNVVTSVSSVSGGEYIDCMSGVENSPGIGKEASTYCPNADLGHADAQRQIGDILYHGAYSQKTDPVRAWVWYSLAAQNGDGQAAEQLAHVTAELDPEQLAEAKRQLASWQPGQCQQELVPADASQ